MSSVEGMGGMQEHFKQALEALDIPLVRKMAAHIWPQYPHAKTDAEALAHAHHARTQMPIAFALRAYSHAWLMERSLPSGLPDHMRRRAERMYPVTVNSVGISVRGSSELGRSVAPVIRNAMEYAVNEAYADGHKDEPKVVKGRMMEARKTAIKKLLG
jgi:hypothetical protein